jgi:hypothetical protein
MAYTKPRPRPAAAAVGNDNDTDCRRNATEGCELGQIKVTEQPLNNENCFVIDDEDDGDDEDANMAIGREVMKTLDKLVTTKSLRLQRVTRLVEATHEAALKRVTSRNQVRLFIPKINDQRETAL